MGIFKSKINNSVVTQIKNTENNTCQSVQEAKIQFIENNYEPRANVKIKKINETSQLPTRGSAAAAGYDVYAWLNGGAIDIPAHETRIIGTGLAFEIPRNLFLGIYPRSGLASKQGLRPANCVGVVDSDYRGEVKVALHNDSDVVRTVRHGDRIAQLILQNFLAMQFEEVEELTETARGQGGFGSTGTK